MRFSPADMRALVIFRALVDNAGFAGAQLVLGVNQSTISFHLKALEDRLGFALCKRGRRGFELTERGQEVYNLSKPLAASILDFEARLGALRNRLAGSLRVGIVDNTVTDETCSLSRVLRSCLAQSDDIDVKLVVSPPEALFAELSSGGIAIAITPLAAGVHGFDQDALYVERHSLYCGRDHALFAGKPERDEVEASHFVVRPYSGNHELAYFPKARVRMHASNMEAQAILILTGEVVGYLPDHYAAQWTRNGMLKALLAPEACITSNFVVATKAGREPTPLERFFIKQVRLQVKRAEAEVADWRKKRNAR